MPDIDLVSDSLREETRTEFTRRVRQQASRLCETLETGAFESPTFGIGVELETYAVDASGTLVKVPDAAFSEGCDKELGVHNAEFHTDPTTLDDGGIASQERQLRERYNRANEAAGTDTRIVLDAMWTVPPAGGSDAYLSATTEHGGYVFATHMTPSPRYHAIDNDVVRHAGGSVPLSVPGVDRRYPTLLVESLTSSLQPHLQVPTVEAFPRYHRLAVRTLGPVLALATNSPLLPLDLYDVDDPVRLLAETDHELRIPVFEGSINEAWEKVRFPDDVEGIDDAIDRLVADPTCAPFLREWIADGPREALHDIYWELDHKRGTYWRWLRSVVGGQPVGGGDERSVRLEYRPLPTQPTIRDNVGLQCLVVGLLRGLVATDHPLAELPHADARASFYNAVADGIDADLAWITREGSQTTDSERIFPELFELTRQGLRAEGVSERTAETYLEPLEARWTHRTTPSTWKLERVRQGIENGATFEEAVRDMQTAYNRRSGDAAPFSTWLEGE